MHMADGSRVPMNHLKPGSLVMHSEAGDSSSVFVFTHRTHETVASFRQLGTACRQTLRLTANHYVYANGGLAAAGIVRVGDKLRTVSGDCVVTDIRTVRDQGIYAPHSVHGDLVVDRPQIPIDTNVVSALDVCGDRSIKIRQGWRGVCCIMIKFN